MVRLFLIFVLCFLSFWAKAQERISLNGQYSSEQLIERIEQQTPFRFVYQSQILPKGKVMELDFKDAKLEEILDFWTVALQLEYKIQGNLILLSPAASARRILSGYVTNQGDGEKLIGANIQVLGTGIGITTNEYGYFALSIPEGNYNVKISYVGFQTLTEEVALFRDISKNFQLQFANVLLDEVSVVSVEDKVEEIQMSTFKVNVALVRKLPAIGGEVDPLRVLQLLPGVQFGTEGTAGFNVRGGSQDQNLILLDGVPMYNVSHLFGFLSVFNADAIQNMDLTKGAFPARYGGRLSSVLDISMKEGSKERISGNFGLSTFASKFFLEGPMAGEKMTFMISARRSFLDPILVPVTRRQKRENGASGGQSNYSFYDINAKVNYTFSTKDRIYLSIYQGNDRYNDNTLRISSFGNSTVESEQDVKLGWGNQVASLRWNHVFQPTLFSNVNLFTSRYRLNTVSNDFVEIRSGSEQIFSEELSDQQSSIRDYGGKIDFSYFPNPTHFVKFGGLLLRHRFVNQFQSNFSITRNNQQEEDSSSLREENNAWEGFVFLEDEITINRQLGVNVGIHASNFWSGGVSYPSIQPRASFRWAINESNAIKGGYAKMTQYLHLLTNSGIGLPTDLWLGSTPEIGPQNANQWSLGYTKTFSRGVDFTVEGFYKKMEGLLDFKDGTTFFLNTGSISEKVTTGDGLAKGVEMMLQKQVGKTQGWISYTWSKSDRVFQDINNGEPFPFIFDRRHDFSVLINQQVGPRWNFSATWIYLTGRAVTLPVSTFVENVVIPSDRIINNPDLIEYSTRNAYRFKPYHRLDISANYEKTTKWGGHRFSVSVYNLYNRQNTFFLSQDPGSASDGSIQLIDNPLFPLIPGFSYGIFF